VIEVVLCTLRAALTNIDAQFTNRSLDRGVLGCIYSRVCQEHVIERCHTKVKHPAANGPVERMGRTIKEAVVKRLNQDDHAPLRRHLADFINAYT
jgi:transposase InsO family protein